MSVFVVIRWLRSVVYLVEPLRYIGLLRFLLAILNLQLLVVSYFILQILWCFIFLFWLREKLLLFLSQGIHLPKQLFTVIVLLILLVDLVSILLLGSLNLHFLVEVVYILSARYLIYYFHCPFYFLIQTLLLIMFHHLIFIARVQMI